MPHYHLGMKRLSAFGCIGCVTALALLAVGCEQSVDRGQSNQPPIPPQGKPASSGFDTIPEGGSKSTLGKSRDAAVRVREQMEARDAEIGKMADDLTNPDSGRKAAEPPPAEQPSRPVSVPAPNF